MRVVIQRVTEASVSVDEKVVGKIGNGFLILLGAVSGDTKKDVEVLVNKISKLRIFPDHEGKSNLSIQDVDGEVLVVSQFTLGADCRKGNRPSFVNASGADEANELYEYFKEYSKPFFRNLECGIFGADMKVALLNDGPFTIVMDCKDGVIL